MPDNDIFRRSLDAGVAFTQLTRQRAETLVRELVKNGEVSRDQAAARVEELLERSRQNSEAILAIVRKEIDDRVAALNLVTREDLNNLAAKLGLPGIPGRGRPASGAPATPGAAQTGASKTPAAKTPAAKTAAAKPAAAAKAPVASNATKAAAAPKAAKSPAAKAPGGSGASRPATTGGAKKSTTAKKA